VADSRFMHVFGGFMRKYANCMPSENALTCNYAEIVSLAQ
jgi:hypothetical protein